MFDDQREALEFRKRLGDLRVLFDVCGAIKRYIEDDWEAARRDYCHESAEGRKEHRFRDLLTLSSALDGDTKTADEYANEYIKGKAKAKARRAAKR
jgi:hypothetical protein